MIIYKRQSLYELFRNKSELMVTQIGERRDYAVKRCIECFLLFQTLKKYPFKTCTLCRYETLETYREKILAATRRKGEIFDEELLYANKLRIHMELQARKDRINQAYKVTVLNEPKCLRITE